MASSRDCLAPIGALLVVLQIFGCQRDEGSSSDRLTELMDGTQC